MVARVRKREEQTFARGDHADVRQRQPATIEVGIGDRPGADE